MLFPPMILLAAAAGVIAQGNVPGVPCKNDLLVDDFSKLLTAVFPGETVPRQVNILGGDYGAVGVDFKIDTTKRSVLLTVTNATSNFWFAKFDQGACFDLRPYVAIQFDVISAAGSDMLFTLTQKSADCSVRVDNGDSTYLTMSNYIKPDGTKKTVTLPLNDFANNNIGGKYDFQHLKDWTLVLPSSSQNALLVVDTPTGTGRGSSNSSYSQPGATSASTGAAISLEESGQSSAVHQHSSNNGGDHHAEPTLMASLKTVATLNLYFNLLLVFVPLGIVAGVGGWSAGTTFALNFIAIIPLAKMLDLATDELSKKVGQAFGALINATFGNAVELIIGVMALREGLIDVVQSSLMGSLLSNLLFVLGLCFLVGGSYHKTLKFSSRGANAAATLLAVAIMGFLIPAAFALSQGLSNPGNGTTMLKNSDSRLINISHATGIILLFTYIAFLVFQLHTHKEYAREEEEDEELSLLTMPVAIGVLVFSTILIGFCAEYLVNSIEGISESLKISRTFIGLIILPIVGNAAEHVTSVFASVRGKMDLALGVALGSSMQIALGVTPILVIAGWIMGMQLTLNFPMFDTVVLFISVTLVSHIVTDGESNWLEGILLLFCYLIVAIAYFYIGE
eukprot:jgi/Hompol1/5476/HPOL_000915-RA